MTVGITDTVSSEDKFLSYARWIDSHELRPRWVKLSHRSGNAGEINNCDALLLTGGGDVNPALYGGNAGHPGVMGVDSERDAFERKLLDLAAGLGVPVLAVCRGMQLANVHFGGTLIADIEESGFPAHRAKGGPILSHEIGVVAGSLLHEVTGEIKGDVNSFHHQGVGRPAPGFAVSARSSDGIIEAMESAGTAAPMMLVQWHPERMSGESVFSKNILNDFLKKAIIYSTSKGKG